MVCFGEEAGACGFWFVVDKLEDGAHVTGGVFVRLTGLSSCVDKVWDLLRKLPVEAGLRAPTGVEVLAQTGVGETLGSARHFKIGAICR